MSSHDYTECEDRACDPCNRAAHSLTDEEYAKAKVRLGKSKCRSPAKHWWA